MSVYYVWIRHYIRQELPLDVELKVLLKRRYLLVLDVFNLLSFWSMFFLEGGIWLSAVIDSMIFFFDLK